MNIALLKVYLAALGITGGSGGSGDVVGPASSTDNALVRFDSTTGKLIKNSTLSTLSDTGVLTLNQAVDATSTDGLVLATTASATVGAQKWSPRIRWTGSGWKTNATAAAQDVSWVAEVQPVQGTANPTSNFVLSSNVNGGAYTSRFAVVGGTGSGSFTVTLGGNATGGITTGPFNSDLQFGANAFSDQNGNLFAVRSNGSFAWSSTTTVTAAADTNLSRVSAGVIGVGTGAAGSVAGTLSLANINSSGVAKFKNTAYSSQPATSATTGAVTADFTASNILAQAELTGNITYTLTPPADALCHLQIIGASDGTSSSFTITWPASVIWYGAAFTATTANKKWLVNMYWDGTNYHAMGNSQV